jgi:hypothetical protein
LVGSGNRLAASITFDDPPELIQNLKKMGELYSLERLQRGEYRSTQAFKHRYDIASAPFVHVDLKLSPSAAQQ